MEMWRRGSSSREWVAFACLGVVARRMAGLANGREVSAKLPGGKLAVKEY